MSLYKPTLSGERFGRLTVTKDHVRGRKLVECICDCGKPCEAMPKLLRDKRVRSCGCLFIDTHKTRPRKRGSITNAQRAKDWRAKNPERFKAVKQEWHAKNRERVRANHIAWLAKNRERVAKVRAAWRARRPEFKRADRAVRRAVEANAVPAWAERGAIRNLYKEARRISMEIGIKHDVDHIVPLNHSLVCGLHVLANLQILPAVENRRKANRFLPDSGFNVPVISL